MAPARGDAVIPRSWPPGEPCASAPSSTPTATVAGEHGGRWCASCSAHASTFRWSAEERLASRPQVPGSQQASSLFGAIAFRCPGSLLGEQRLGRRGQLVVAILGELLAAEAHPDYRADILAELTLLGASTELLDRLRASGP